MAEPSSNTLANTNIPFLLAVMAMINTLFLLPFVR